MVANRDSEKIVKFSKVIENLFQIRILKINDRSYHEIG